MIEYNERKKENQVAVKYSQRVLESPGRMEMGLKSMTEKTSRKMAVCHDDTEFATDIEREKWRVFNAETCSNRFCPICSWRLAKRDSMKIGAIMDWILDPDVHDKSFICANFTAPNVKGDVLSSELDRYTKSFKNMLKREVVKSATSGYICKTEVTYNGEEFITKDMWEGKGRYKGKSMAEYFARRGLGVGDMNSNYDTYHPHYHVIFAVDRHYFTSRQYIKHEKWLELWQHAMNDKSITNVYVKKLRKDNSGRKEVHEIAKYAAKPQDYLHSEEVFGVFYNALKGRQVLRTGCLFKDGSKKYNEYLEAKKQKQNHEFDKYIEGDKTAYCYMIRAIWNNSEYREESQRPLTEKEKALLAQVACTQWDLKDC